MGEAEELRGEAAEARGEAEYLRGEAEKAVGEADELRGEAESTETERRLAASMPESLFEFLRSRARLGRKRAS